MKYIKFPLICCVILFILLLFIYKSCHSSDSHANETNDVVESIDNSCKDSILNRRLNNAKNQGIRLDGNNSSDLKDVETNDTIEDISIHDDIQIDSLLLALLPAPIKDRPEQILVRTSYIVSYNKVWKLPNWVAWHLTDDHVDGNAPRRNSFREDLEVPRPRATPADYKGSGWSRGHMCPSGDNKWNPRANHDTFLMTNLCPQDANLNSGLWNSIEMDCRKWAKKYGDVFIICGPVPLRQPYETIGDNKVAVPKAFFKIVLCLNDSIKAFGFVVKNKSGEKKTNLYYNTVREVERLTHIDFFPLLPDSIEDRVETHADINEW